MSFIRLQFISMRFIIATLLVVVCYGVPYVYSQQKNTTQTRSFLQFGSLISSAIGNPFSYNGYGCWCGKGNRGDLVVDETDRCCETHDNCWELVKKNFPDCNPFWRHYSYKKTSDGDIQCKDPMGTCDYDTCQCDKAAVECFVHHRKTSYDPDFDNWEGICSETTKAPEVDPEKCPRVWNNRDTYSRDSLVSINGIRYQSLFTNGPGQYPKNGLYGSQLQGTIATWKKLGPCRRTSFGKKF